MTLRTKLFAGLGLAATAPQPREYKESHLFQMP